MNPYETDALLRYAPRKEFGFAMIYLVILLSALFAGFIQSVSGFGAGTTFMSVVPYFLCVISAAAISNCMSVSLTAMLTYRYRRFINKSYILFPAVFYITGGTISIYFSTGIDKELLKLILGAFLLVLAICFILFNQRIHIKVNLLTLFVCGFVSGICDGLFGIGGPLMVLVFLALIKSKEEYLGTISLFFFITTTYNFILRVYRGIFTFDLLPYAIVSVIAVFGGLQIGNRMVDRIDSTIMKKIIYSLIGLSGIITFVTTFMD